ncbi:uncharacterized protein EV154DRAFT_572867 [Mucor mucedo]|uniref:uncharacterized protein n=1 Tax=Mucor mucedo TaxID=29922 RepID=UPI00221FA908|nr:uncharacterized protein EV154DRAFT_572867 [Mucor mucedo]KAI7863046.1 hypothetical protein EV154DRAFT_572867 [Mucor mucedo]
MNKPTFKWSEFVEKQRLQCPHIDFFKNYQLLKSPITTTTNANDATETISLAEAKRIITNSLPLTSIDPDNNEYASSLMRFSLYQSLGFNQMENFPSDVMLSLLINVINVNCRVLTRKSRILELINVTADKVLICILQVKTIVKSLPFNNQKKEIKEFELCTRYLQPCFQKIFDSDDLDVMFK